MIREIALIDVKPGMEAEFEAGVAKATPLFQRAHGCRSFELHRSIEHPNRYNAHLPDIGTGPARRSLRKGRGSDHRHFRGQIAWYDFVSPEKLMEDFWNDVQRVMEEEGVPWTE